MPTSRGKKQKPSIFTPNLPEVQIRLKAVPYFAFTSDAPELSGHTFVGKSPEDALINARAALARQYKGIAIPKIIIQD
jgi:hypothetical protein